MLTIKYNNYTYIYNNNYKVMLIILHKIIEKKCKPFSINKFNLN